MKWVFHGLAALVVMAFGFWAYRENYATQVVMREVRQLNNAIGNTRARINMLDAEWAYLNRPDRLREMVDLNFEKLGLLPLLPEAFAAIESIPFPPPAPEPSPDPAPLDVPPDAAASQNKADEQANTL